MNDTYTREQELRALRDLSARLGRDPLLTQASSGNISLKFDDSLWIKASGKWLCHADADDFLIHVRLARARACVSQHIPVPETIASSPHTFTASIETAMHAVLPQAVVIHLHSVHTIACAVRDDAPAYLAARLAGLNWLWIPYVPSGNFLAAEIASRLARSPGADVLILGNHGLVVCGSCCRSAESLLAVVEERLAIEPRPLPPLDLDRLTASLDRSAWFLPASPEIHTLAADPLSLRILSGGILYPCQAIFLPDILPAADFAYPAILSLHKNTQPAARLLPGQGVFCRKEITAAERQMLCGLAGIVRRLHEPARLRYLSACEIEDVLGGEISGYRLAADRNTPVGVLS